MTAEAPCPGTADIGPNGSGLEATADAPLLRDRPAAQILHIGAYGDEPATIARLQAEISEAGLRVRGVHHEIYLSDPNRARPDRMKTLLRQGVEG